MISIGSHTLSSRLLLAPMAGITDLPFRRICREMGAALAASEMVSANEKLRYTRKSQLRVVRPDETAPRVVQIAGSDPVQLGESARYHAAQGAQIIDINMGCPAKKVCNRAAGSALLRDERLVASILHQVVQSVSVPVTLKIRTGWDTRQRNACEIARIAEAEGIALLTIHGRTRACRFKGTAEYDTIAAVKQSVGIPIIANGDIDSPRKAQYVLAHTGADGLMIGRAARGRPWLFREINHYLRTGDELPAPSTVDVYRLMARHLHELHEFYGDYLGIRIARKHMGWYLTQQMGMPACFQRQFNTLETKELQQKVLENFFSAHFNPEELVA